MNSVPPPPFAFPCVCVRSGRGKGDTGVSLTRTQKEGSHLASDRRRLCAVFLAVFLFCSAFLQVARCQADPEVGVSEDADGGDVEIVGEDMQESSEPVYGSAPGVDTIWVLPRNPKQIAIAGEKTESLVGLNNGGERAVKVHALSASIHLPFDHRYFVQNLTLQEFYDAQVPISAQATFPYVFAVHKNLQPGAFDLVGTVVYDVEEQRYNSVFYNGTIEVVEAGGFLSTESVFLVTISIALTGLLGLWIYGRLQTLSKKSKRVAKVEVGTGTSDAAIDEWLKGTSFDQSQSSKSKKKK